jgi:hypothetical protein
VDSHSIFWPAASMAALTFVVWVRMYVVRIREMQRERIDPQRVASSAEAAALLRDTRASDNFRNLFELPVLFYLAIAVMLKSATITLPLLALAWVFVALRVAHSAIHCSYNRVMHRFSVYIAGAVVLWALWALLALGMLQ